MEFESNLIYSLTKVVCEDNCTVWFKIKLELNFPNVIQYKQGAAEPVLDWVLLLVRHFIKIFKKNFYGLIGPIKSEIVSTLKKRRKKESCKI